MRAVSAAMPIRLVAPVLRLPVPLALFLVAALLRVVCFAIFYVGSVMTGHNGVIDPFDSIGIDHWAWYAASYLRAGELVNLTSFRYAGAWDVGFTYFVALQYFVVGHHPEVPRIVNAILAASSAPAVYIAARQIPLAESISRRAGWLTALWPLSIYWAGYDLLKDPAVWFFLALALVAITANSNRRFTVLGVAAAVPIQFVRFYMGMALYAFLPLVAILRRDWKALVATVVVLAVSEVGIVAAGYPSVLSIVPYTGNGIPFISHAAPSVSSGIAGDIAAIGGNDSTATSQAEGTGTNGVAVLQGGQRATSKRLAIGLLITALGPRPALKDIVHPTLDSGMYPGLLVWILLIPFTLLGFWRAARSRDAKLLSVAIFAACLWIGISVLFGGGGFRQREMAFPSTLILTAVGLEPPWARRWWWIYGAILVAGAMALGLREAGLY